jgi:hypothetical protein
VVMSPEPPANFNIELDIPGAIEVEQFLLDEHGFGDRRTPAAGSGESGEGQQMQKQDRQVAHWAILASRIPAMLKILQFARHNRWHSARSGLTFRYVSAS